MLRVETAGVLPVKELDRLFGPFQTVSSRLGAPRTEFNFYRIPSAVSFGAPMAVAGRLHENSLFAVRESVTYDEELQSFLALPAGRDWAVAASLPGEWFALNSAWAGGFWHWMMECIPRAYLLERTGYTGGYLVPDGGSFILDSLRLLGIDAARVQVSRGAVTVLETLVVSTPFLGQFDFDHFPEMFFGLRERLLAAAACECPPLEPHRRLYIARAQSRRVLNEPDFLEVIGRHGFGGAQLMERYPLAHQIQMARDAHVVIGPHGAGMTLTMLMPPGSAVIELFPPTYINPCMTATARHLRQRHHAVPARVMVPNQAYQHGTDIVADLRTIDQILDSLT